MMATLKQVMVARAFVKLKVDSNVFRRTSMHCPMLDQALAAPFVATGFASKRKMVGLNSVTMPTVLIMTVAPRRAHWKQSTYVSAGHRRPVTFVECLRLLLTFRMAPYILTTLPSKSFLGRLIRLSGQVQMDPIHCLLQIQLSVPYRAAKPL